MKGVWVVLVLAVVAAGCTSADEWAYRRAQQTATIAAGYALATDVAWEAQAMVTMTADAQRLAIINGHLAETQQAQVVLATEAAYVATQEAGRRFAAETQEARDLAVVQATQAEQRRVTETAAGYVRETAQAQALATAHAARQTEVAVQVTATADAIAAAMLVADRTATATYAVNRSRLTETAAAAVGAAQATSVAAQAEMAHNASQRDTITTQFRAWWVYAEPLIWVGVVMVCVFMGYLFGYDVWRRYLENRVIQRSANGAAPVVIAAGSVINPDLMVLPNVNPAAPVYLPAGMHAQAASDQARVRAIQAMQDQAQSRRLLANMAQNVPAAAPVVGEPVMPDRADWAKFEQWNGQAFLLGVGANEQPVTFDPANTPHLLVAATSGAGKSMTILRPMAAAALSRGYQVVLANDAGGDFAPLGNHPNLIRVGEEPRAIASALTALAAEVDRRSGLLRAEGVSTWSRLAPERRDGPSIMLMLDELVALVRDADAELRRTIWRKLIKITSKGRKMSVVTVIGTTDPTERTLGPEGLTVRDNCSRVALRVLDASVSRVIVSTNGAEALGEDQFMARLGGALRAGVAFHPEDDQLERYVKAAPALTAGEPKWLLQPGDTASLDAVEDEGNARRIRELHTEGMSMRSIEMVVFGYTGGAAHREVAAVLGATVGATGRSGATGADFGQVAAEVE